MGMYSFAVPIVKVLLPLCSIANLCTSAGPMSPHAKSASFSSLAILAALVINGLFGGLNMRLQVGFCVYAILYRVAVGFPSNCLFEIFFRSLLSSALMCLFIRAIPCRLDFLGFDG